LGGRAKDVPGGWGAGEFAAGRLLSGKLVDVSHDVVFIEYANHSGPVDKCFGYALCVYFLYAKLANQQYVKHGYR
jgi:hypothetical protein